MVDQAKEQGPPSRFLCLLNLLVGQHQKLKEKKTQSHKICNNMQLVNGFDGIDFNCSHCNPHWWSDEKEARSSPSPTMFLSKISSPIHSSFQQGDVNFFQFLQVYILKSLDFDLSDPELTESTTKLKGMLSKFENHWLGGTWLFWSNSRSFEWKLPKKASVYILGERFNTKSISFQMLNLKINCLWFQMNINI